MTSAASETPDTPFYSQPGLHVEIYDELHREIPGGDDVGFFRELAASARGPVLELGCGTGRVAVPLAEAGISVVGLDRSRSMLDVAERRRRSLPSEVRRRLSFVEADMQDFRLGRRFGLVFAAFRVFMVLPDPASQRAALATIGRHVRPGGLVAIDVFDPRLDLLTVEPGPPRAIGEVRHPLTGNLVRVTALDRVNDHVSQRFTEHWRFAELDDREGTIREEVETLVLRWTYRCELHHLLELAGFEVAAEYSDYAGSPPAYGHEIVVVARRRVSRR
jgi:SAM-dependent methyltransferase